MPLFADVESVCTDCGVSPPWLLYLCIAFGILFLVMLIINVFLCSAMTCSCARTDSIEKEPSIIEEFDPYTRSWQGSQYGSRWVHKLNALKNRLKPFWPRKFSSVWSMKLYIFMIEKSSMKVIKFLLGGKFCFFASFSHKVEKSYT